MQPDLIAQRRPGAFAAQGFKATIARVLDEIAEHYASDSIPWVVGYSGGKDSTATLQLVWMALSRMPPERLVKPLYVISTDTLVENPVVAAWVARSLDRMADAAARSGLPISSHRLTPKVTDTFWVNLIGRGYPAPRPKFRWCTERLKINPSNQFISDVVKANGEAIVVLGMRRAESQVRARVMDRLATDRSREWLSPNASLQNSYVYTPIEDWTDDDVWAFLMQVANPWGFPNRDLLTMYQGASADGECPLVIDTSTPSCGSSRFGCWTCTLVERDRSMQAMIRNDQEKEWMLPLLELRDELAEDDRHRRDFRRMNGTVQLHGDRVIPGPYTQEARAHWLTRLLKAQDHIRQHGPEEMRDFELLSSEELAEIRRIWVIDKHEIEDLLPALYERATGAAYAGPRLDDGTTLGSAEMDMLRQICDDDLHYQLVRELLDVERRYRSSGRRHGLHQAIEKAFRRGAHGSAGEAEDRALARRDEFADRRAVAAELPLPYVVAVDARSDKP